MQCRHLALALASLIRCACAFVLLDGWVRGCDQRGQVDKPFPTDDEINLLLTQVDRAAQQYKLADRARKKFRWGRATQTPLPVTGNW